MFPAIDTDRRVALLFHVSLRPAAGEGIFTAKFNIDGHEHRYVGRSPVPRDLTTMRPVANERIRFDVVEPGERFHIGYDGEELSADVTYTARFPAYDFEDGPKAPKESTLGDLGRSVFPFHHYEQGLVHEGTITFKVGERAGETIEIAGYANRDHSWGWREDLSFHFHHWICASFADRYIQGSVMHESSYPDPKPGGWISTDAGNDPVVDIDYSDAYWLAPNEPIPPIDRVVRYRLTTLAGEVATLVAHVDEDLGRLYLDLRAPDHAQAYQDVQLFLPFTLLETGQRGAGVLELGKKLEGAEKVEAARRRSASRVSA
ncbi:MAG: hypothetical protein ACRD0A_15935 [Acidimicrobiales bacterium]